MQQFFFHVSIYVIVTRTQVKTMPGMVPWEPRVSGIDSFSFSQHSCNSQEENSSRRLNTILVVLLRHWIHCVSEYEAGETLIASSCKAVFSPCLFFFFQNMLIIYVTGPTRLALGLFCKMSA